MQPDHRSPCLSPLFLIQQPSLPGRLSSLARTTTIAPQLTQPQIKGRHSRQGRAVQPARLRRDRMLLLPPLSPGLALLNPVWSSQTALTRRPSLLARRQPRRHRNVRPPLQRLPLGKSCPCPAHLPAGSCHAPLHLPGAPRLNLEKRNREEEISPGLFLLLFLAVLF